MQVKGSPKAKEEVNSITKTLGNAKEMALSTKAAIVAALIAFEKLVTAPLSIESNYQRFINATGLGIKYLQQIQTTLHAAPFGVPMQQSLDFVSGMTERLTQFKGAGDAAISMLGGMGGLHKEAAKLSEYDIVSGLHEVLSGTNLDEERKRLLAQAFGMDANMRAAFEKSGDWSNVKVSDLISNKEAGQGMKGQVAIENFKRSISLAMKGVANAFTPDVMKSLTGAVIEIGKLATAFAEFAKNTKLIDGISFAIDTLTAALNALNKAISAGKDIFTGNITADTAENVKKAGMQWLQLNPVYGPAMNLYKHRDEIDKKLKDILPKAPSVLPGNNKSSSVEMNQTVNIAGDFTNPADITEALNKANQNAYRQFGAQLQVV